ncbi:MAG TPA: outer membrane beta-barrel protein [Steroidobacteraceae bacterium]|nr:outer membrane beta-barrel protein [Steroidobacteraceae bacterium]
MSTKALALSVRGRYEFANSIGVFGAVGLSDHHVDTRLRISSDLFDPISRKDSDRVTFWQLAAGVDWAFHPNWSWRLQYERHMGADSKSFFGVVRGDLGWLSTGLSYRF